MQTEKPYLAFAFTYEHVIKNAVAHVKEALAKGEKPSLLPLTADEYDRVNKMTEPQRALFVSEKLKSMQADDRNKVSDDLGKWVLDARVAQLESEKKAEGGS